VCSSDLGKLDENGKPLPGYEAKQK
jgi:hypothetical protein